MSSALIDILRRAVENRTAPDARTRHALGCLNDPVQAQKAGKVLAGLSAADGELRPLTIGVVATSTVGGFPDLLRGRLVAAGIQPTIACAPYGAFELSLTAPDAAGIGDADLLSCLLHPEHFVPDDWSPLDHAGLEKHVQQRCDDLVALVGGYVERHPTPVVLNTVPLPYALRNTVVSWRSRAALAQVWHQLNARILGLADTYAQVAVIDFVSVLADLGEPARDNRMYRYADIAYTSSALLALADEVRRFIQAYGGLSRKVLALDLDNTLWGGVLGEDGIGGVAVAGLYPANCYHELQQTVARLREQGVILVLASKNDADLVTEALTEHPDIVLRPDAFSATAVNWAPKPANLATAAGTLGLATNAFVFMDDSPFERGHVADELPDIALVAADGDPAELVDSLLRGGWFDVLDLTDTDRARPRLYKTRADRETFSGSFGSTAAYLAALDLRLAPEPVTAYTAGRVAQLAGRTNQFNLTGIRYDEATTTAQLDDPTWIVTSFQVADRFGDEGIVGAAWIRCDPDAWRVTNLVLSCRVLGRGVELAIAAWITGEARRAGVRRIEGRFTPSKKNAVAAAFWTQAGFTAEDDGTYALAIGDGNPTAPEWITTTNREATP